MNRDSVKCKNCFRVWIFREHEFTNLSQTSDKTYMSDVYYSMWTLLKIPKFHHSDFIPIFLQQQTLYFGNLLQALAQLIYLSTTNIYDHHLYSLKSVTQKGLGLCDFLINRGNARLKFPRHRCTFGALSFSRLECIIWFFPLCKVWDLQKWLVPMIKSSSSSKSDHLFDNYFSWKRLSFPGCLVFRINEFSFALNPFGGNKDGK